MPDPYLAHVSQALIAAIREADELVREGKTGKELVELVRHASALHEIIADGAQGLENPPEGMREAVFEMGVRLTELRSVLPHSMVH